MSIEDTLADLSKKAAAAEQNIATARARREQYEEKLRDILKQLQDEYGCSDVASAKKRLEELQGVVEDKVSTIIERAKELA